MRIADPFIQELEMEAATTRRVLERIPQDKLDFQPHGTSMTLGQLAMHVAQVPGAISALASLDGLDNPPSITYNSATSSAELLDTLTTSVAAGRAFLEGVSDERMMGMWTMTAGGKVVMQIPRVGFVRAIMFNHWYHHRGQLLVYLRMLEVPVPSVYGPTADETPFA